MKRILLVHHPGTAFNNPTLQAFIQYALERSVEVDVRCKNSRAPKPDVKHLTWQVYGPLVAKFKRWFLKQSSFDLAGRIVATLEAWFVLKRRYDLIIGVDREGIIDAGYYANILKIPFVYFSFEIMFADETGPRAKSPEKRSSRLADLWLVQDDDRARCLAEENGLHRQRRFLCPVASAGIGAVNRTRLRDRLGIGKEKKVAILIGSMTRWAMSDDIVRAAAGWPDNWVLIVHERYGRTRRLLAGQTGSAVRDGRIVLSDMNTACVDDMGTILAGVDVGLAFYNPVFTTPYNGKNIRHIGLSSGKIATYLRYGIPVLTNAIGAYADRIARYRLGRVVDHPNRIGAVLPGMDAADYTARCQAYFAQHLDADLFMPALFDRLAHIAGASTTRC
jgi:hypothetical protein